MLLLDTHVWLWMTFETRRLGAVARARLEDPAERLLFSAASSWEIAIKYRNGQLPLPEAPAKFIPEQIRLQGVDAIDVEHAHALAVAELPLHHRDPFDRLLVVQARQLGISIMTVDPQLAKYDVQILDART